MVAPSLVPKGRGDKVKTDKRDARRLFGLHRAGQLVPIGIPTPEQEAVRDLCPGPPPSSSWSTSDIARELGVTRQAIQKMLAC